MVIALFMGGGTLALFAFTQIESLMRTAVTFAFAWVILALTTRRIDCDDRPRQAYLRGTGSAPRQRN